MRKTLRLLFSLLVLSLTIASHAESGDKADSVRALVRNDRSLANGLDRIYVSPAKGCPAPKGWESFYIAHYGRHGSRYAYAGKTYTAFLDALRKGGSEGNLTPYGKEMLQGMENLYKEVEYHVGDLTRKGWDQHQKIAERMISRDRKAFKGKSRIDAVASSSQRSILSMSSFCLKAGEALPKADIYEHLGTYELQATAPNSGNNPLRLSGASTVNPYPVTPAEMFYAVFPDYENVLGKFFSSQEKVKEYIHEGDMDDKESMYRFFIYLYMLDAGLGSLDTERTLPEIFTDIEFAKMWEVDNYLRFDEYVRYKTACCSVWLDMVLKADERLRSGERGADLRFGHDHVLMTLLMIADMEGFDELPENPEDLSAAFRTFRSPMAGNIQLVFYRRKHGRSTAPEDVRVRLLLNEEPSSFTPLKADEDGLYRWSELRAYLLSRCRKYARLPASL